VRPAGAPSATADIDLRIPHQANLHMSRMVQRPLGLSAAQVFNTIQRYGDTTAATIPIALAEAVRDGRLDRADLLSLTAFGSGFTWGSTLVTRVMRRDSACAPGGRHLVPDRFRPAGPSRDGSAGPGMAARHGFPGLRRRPGTALPSRKAGGSATTRCQGANDGWTAFRGAVIIFC